MGSSERGGGSFIAAVLAGARSLAGVVVGMAVRWAMTTGRSRSGARARDWWNAWLHPPGTRIRHRPVGAPWQAGTPTYVLCGQVATQACV